MRSVTPDLHPTFPVPILKLFNIPARFYQKLLKSPIQAGLRTTLLVVADLSALLMPACCPSSLLHIAAPLMPELRNTLRIQALLRC